MIAIILLRNYNIISYSTIVIICSVLIEWSFIWSNQEVLFSRKGWQRLLFIIFLKLLTYVKIKVLVMLPWPAFCFFCASSPTTLSCSVASGFLSLYLLGMLLPPQPLPGMLLPHTRAWLYIHSVKFFPEVKFSARPPLAT